MASRPFCQEAHKIKIISLVRGDFSPGCTHPRRLKGRKTWVYCMIAESSLGSNADGKLSNFCTLLLRGLLPAENLTLNSAFSVVWLKKQQQQQQQKKKKHSKKQKNTTKNKTKRFLNFLSGKYKFPPSLVPPRLQLPLSTKKSRVTIMTT